MIAADEKEYYSQIKELLLSESVIDLGIVLNKQHKCFTSLIDIAEGRCINDYMAPLEMIAEDLGLKIVSSTDMKECLASLIRPELILERLIEIENIPKDRYTDNKYIQQYSLIRSDWKELLNAERVFLNKQ